MKTIKLVLAMLAVVALPVHAATVLYSSTATVTAPATLGSVASYTIPAGTFDVDGRQVRITTGWVVPSEPPPPPFPMWGEIKTIVETLGSSTILSYAHAGSPYRIITTITRLSATTLKAQSSIGPPGGRPLVITVPLVSEDTSAALTLDVSAQTATYGALTLSGYFPILPDSVLVELLP